MSYAPAILQTIAAPNMSDRYVHVNTSDVITIMNDAGFDVAETKVDKTHKNDPAFQRHMVVFRNNNITTPDGTYQPQMLWMNSHNGKSPAVMRLGMYRFVCANGLVVGTDLAKERIRHVGDLARQVIDRVRLLSAKSVSVFNQIDEWSKIDLAKEQREEFARRAAIIRFGAEKVQQYNALDLLNVRRAEDDHGDLWSTFNVIQENAVKGGMVGRNANNRQIRSKMLKSIGLDVGFNEQLWTLAEEFA